MSRRRATGLAVALAALMVAAVVVTSRGDERDGTVTLTLSTLRSNALAELISEYRAVEPNVRIVVTTNPVDTYQTVLRTRLASGNAPDMFAVWPGNGNSMSIQQIARLGVLADLSGSPWARRLPDRARALLGSGGKVYVWSAGTSVIGAVYNRGAFRAVGAEVPRTWPELLAVCDTFKRAGLPAIAVGNQTPWVAQLIDYALVPSLDSDLQAGRTIFTGPGWRATLTRYLELSRRGCFQPNPNGTTLERVEQLVGSGKAGMAVQVAPAINFIKAAHPKADLGMFPFPAADRAEDLWVPAGIAVGLAVNARSRHAEEARRFVDFLGRPENARRFNEEAGNIPLAAGDPAPAFLASFVPYLRAGRTVPFPDQLWPNADTQREHIAVAQELLADRITVDQALERLDRAYELR